VFELKIGGVKNKNKKIIIPTNKRNLDKFDILGKQVEKMKK